MSAIVEFRSPDAGFDQPIEMWLACHQRVRRFAALLQRLRVHLLSAGADEEAQMSAASIRRYFNEAAPRHHEDEEVDMLRFGASLPSPQRPTEPGWPSPCSDWIVKAPSTSRISGGSRPTAARPLN